MALAAMPAMALSTCTSPLEKGCFASRP
jgi:hypothetical protein